jgi:CheY-like chemotaxis protein
MDQRRCNLLLVEDQLDLAALMEQALEDGGGRVTHAYSVFDALGLLDTQRFDGAVLDVELRDGVVFPVADRLAELGIPYLFVSAVYDQLVPLRHRRATFVAKPFHIDQLQKPSSRSWETPARPRHALSGRRRDYARCGLPPAPAGAAHHRGRARSSCHERRCGCRQGRSRAAASTNRERTGRTPCPGPAQAVRNGCGHRGCGCTPR